MTTQAAEAYFLKATAVAASVWAGIVTSVIVANPVCLPLCLGIGGCIALLR